MKQLIAVIVIILGSVSLAAGPARALGATEVGTVTGTGQGPFDSRAVWGVVNLDRMEMGTGVFLEPNGSATGVFHAVLVGHSLLGQPQNITVEGKVNQGAKAADGLRADVSGIATVDLGDGKAPLPGVPFSASTSAGKVVLAIQAITLPAAGLTSGAVAIE